MSGRVGKSLVQLFYRFKYKIQPRGAKIIDTIGIRRASIGGTCNEKDLSLFVPLHMLARNARLFEGTLFFPIGQTNFFAVIDSKTFSIPKAL